MQVNSMLTKCYATLIPTCNVYESINVNVKIVRFKMFKINFYNIFKVYLYCRPIK